MFGLFPTPTTYIEPEPIVIETVVATTTAEEVKDPEETRPGEACNCYLYVKNRVHNLPRMIDILPNAEPIVGAVAVEWFGNIKHVSLVAQVTETGVWVEESNVPHCQFGTRFIPFDKHSLVGFWIAG